MYETLIEVVESRKRSDRTMIGSMSKASILTVSCYLFTADNTVKNLLQELIFNLTSLH